jgi:hypothetical protein
MVKNRWYGDGRLAPIVLGGKACQGEAIASLTPASLMYLLGKLALVFFSLLYLQEADSYANHERVLRILFEYMQAVWRVKRGNKDQLVELLVLVVVVNVINNKRIRCALG